MLHYTHAHFSGTQFKALMLAWAVGTVIGYCLAK